MGTYAKAGYTFILNSRVRAASFQVILNPAFSTGSGATRFDSFSIRLNLPAFLTVVAVLLFPSEVAMMDKRLLKPGANTLATNHKPAIGSVSPIIASMLVITPDLCEWISSSFKAAIHTGGN